MTRYLMYKHKINNMGDERLPKNALNSSQNHVHLKWVWCTNTMAWFNENDTLQDIINFKNIITSKSIEKIWCKKELDMKWKSRYYKVVMNPNLKVQKYLSILSSSKNNINITKIRTNSLELNSERGHWSVPKTPWEEMIFHICESWGLSMKITFS